MLPEVADFLPLDFSRHRFVHIVERPPIDSTFLLCHTVASAIGSSRSVRLAALTRSVAHYRHLLAKTGCYYEKSGVSIDEKHSVEGVSVEYIDGSRIMIEAMLGADDLEYDNTALPGKNFYDCSGMLDRLFGAVTRIDSRTGAGCVLVLDGVSVLCDLCRAGGNHWLACVSSFLARLRAGLLPGDSLVLVTTAAEEDGCLQRLVNVLDSWADLTVEVRPLSTGVCADITGVMEVRRERLLPPAQCQFKARDKDVKVFAVGMSAAVL